ncbi:MAG: hypothetical protein KVP17_001803 [Porospora cf. gigantea B]|uniref:uncharacterized protein n=1 Tax=Porospora cf. gigantea B TaxID=2853592 RepID=UPI00357180A6|nr:MAG: hypothetical protein KVP17_001803 [Porospora cf. gigantea B]
MAKVTYRHGRSGKATKGAKPRDQGKRVVKTKGKKLKEVLGSIGGLAGKKAAGTIKKNKFRWRDDPSKAGFLKQSNKVLAQEKALEDALSKKKKHAPKDRPLPKKAACVESDDESAPLASYEEYHKTKEQEKQARTRLRQREETPDARAERLDRTLFVRNLSHDAQRQDVYEFFASRGGVGRVSMVKTKDNLFKGSAFVEMKKSEDAQAILAEEAKTGALLSGATHGLGNSAGNSVSFGGGLIFQGRSLSIVKAVARETAVKFEEKKRDVKDKRNLHLATAGLLDAPILETLPNADKSRRLEAMKQMRAKLQSPNTFFNPRRLVFRNLPTKLTNGELKQEISEFLVANCEEDLQRLRHVVMSNGKKREMDVVDPCLQKRRIGPKLLATKAVKAQIINKKNLVLKNRETGPKTQRFAFAEFAHATLARRTLEHFNNNVNAFGTGQRPVVEYALEDHRALLRARDRKQRIQTKQKESMSKSKIVVSVT